MKDKLIGWIEQVYKDHGPMWAIGLGLIVVGLLLAAILYGIDLTAWLN